jgi:hypothetical protein
MTRQQGAERESGFTLSQPLPRILGGASVQRPPAMKTCNRCRVEKPLDAFWFNKRSGRYRPACTDCIARYKRAYRQARKPLKPPTRPGFRLCKKCRREKTLIEFPFFKRAKGLRRHECHTCHRARMNIHYLQNKAYRIQRQREWYAANPSRMMTAERRAQVNRNARLKRLGAACACCGEVERKFLTIDHVNDDGAEHRRQHNVAVRLYRWIIKTGFPEDIQILC